MAKSRRNWPGGYGKQADYSKRLDAGERCGWVAAVVALRHTVSTKRDLLRSWCGAILRRT